MLHSWLRLAAVSLLEALMRLFRHYALRGEGGEGLQKCAQVALLCFSLCQQ